MAKKRSFLSRVSLLSSGPPRLPLLFIFLVLSNFYFVPQVAAVLPSPSLTSPPNGSGNQSTTPTFIWSAVTGATSYRIMVATSPAALPTDPNATTCVASCVIEATPASAFYTPASGVLTAGTTYYWQVKGRGADVGAWSSQWSFTTAFRISLCPSHSWSYLFELWERAGREL